MGTPEVTFDFDTLDDDGYPSEEFQDFIISWPYQNGFKNLIDLVWVHWFYDYPYKNSYVEKGVWVYEFSTGGWSGNEDLISALQENYMFWAFCWYSSRRGGHHVFKVKV